LVVWTLLASEIATVKLKVPVAVGVPLMAPVAGARVRPAGSAPVVMLQLPRGGVPPVAARVRVGYTAFAVAGGKGEVVSTVGAGLIVIE
jgi:hypothetical protein